MSERWKPEIGENYWFINFSGAITKDAISLNGNHGMEFDSIMIENGNCFRTKAEALAAAEKVRELLLSLHETVTDCNQSEQPTTNSSQLPKLTAEVFDRPDCPEWAEYAAVNKDGSVRVFEFPPKIVRTECWHTQLPFQSMEVLLTKFDSSDWQKSLIERPAKLPDWCKYDAICWHKRCGYFKVTMINKVSSRVDIQQVDDKSKGYLSFHTVCNDVCQARLRPYNADEMKALMGKVIEKGPSMHIVTGFENVFDNECMVHVNSCLYGANDLLQRFTIDNKPAGVLEHLENGEWVK